MRAFAAISLFFALLLPAIVCAESSGDLSLESGDVSSLEEEVYFAPEEMVTGATKRAVPLSEAPANVTVITHEDIVQSGVTNLGEVFRRVPGMDVFWITAAETQASIRGFAGPTLDGERVAVLIDGRTFYQDFLSATYWAELPIPLDDIKRIEVIKGPMSALYGNKAMLGIINIVTFEPEETHTTLVGGGGMHWTGMGEFIHAGKFSDGYWYKITGNYVRNNEYSDRALDGSTKARENLAITGKFLAKPTDSTRAHLAGSVSQNYDLIQVAGIAPWNERRAMLEGRLEQSFGQWGDLTFHAYWERDYASSPTYPTMGSLIIDTVDAEIRHSISFDITDDIQNTLTYGAGYRFSDLSNRPVQSINNFAGFLQDEFRFFDKLILTGGFRVDYQRDFVGLNTAANGCLVYLAHPMYTFRVGFGTAFNTPHYIHYYLNIAQPAMTGVTLLGNRNLRAERILYLDVGNTINPLDWMTIHANFFYYRLNNLLVPQTRFVLPATIQAFFVNDGGAEAIGGELGISAKPFDWFEAYANWSYEKFTPINGNANQTANLGNPKNKASAGTRFCFFDGRLTFNVDFNYVMHYWRQNSAANFPNTGAVRVDDFYLLNARLGYWPIKDHLELSVSTWNVLDDNTPQVPMNDLGGQPTLAEQPRFVVLGALRYVF